MKNEELEMKKEIQKDELNFLLPRCHVASLPL